MKSRNQITVEQCKALLEYAQTEVQRNALNAVIEADGNRSKAAKKLGRHVRKVNEAISRVKGYATNKHDNPELGMDIPLPDGWTQPNGTLHIKDGKVVQSWPRIKQEAITPDLIKIFTEEFLRDIEPLPQVEEPRGRKVDKTVIPWFQIGDAHIGMLAYEDEVGHNFNLEIAERELLLAMKLQIERTPKCERCVLQDLGDGTHFENFAAITAASGHQLDAAARFPKVISVYARIISQIIKMLLQKFKYVDVILNQGNHSRVNDMWMKVCLDMVYHKNKRLTVLNNSSVFIPYRMGNTFVLCHHTDKCKPAKMAEVMSSDFRQDFGEAKYKYLDGGHIHTRVMASELKGCVYESWNQLAPSDAFAHDHGWRSRSCLTVVLRSKIYGEYGRLLVTAEEVQDIIDGLPPGTTANKRREVHTV